MKSTSTHAFKGFAPQCRTIPMSEPDKTYTFTAAAAALDVDESTLRKRWWTEKIEPAYRHCSEPLRVVVRTTKAGSPVYEFTPFGLEIFQQYQASIATGQQEDFLKRAIANYPPPEPEPQTVEAQVMPDVGSSLALPLSALSVTTDPDKFSEAKQDFEAEQEVGGQKISDLLGLLVSYPQVLAPVMRQAGRQTGQALFNEFQQGMNETLQQNLQTQADAMQGKSADPDGSPGS
jgi:hypothetical protein